MKRLLILVLLVAGALSASAADAPLLPQEFGGWQKAAAAQASKDAAVADPTNAALLKEYNFTDFETATYTRPGRQITVKAARFADATGAYGAFTFYREPQMITEKVGDQGASANQRVIFYRGNILVQAALDRVTAMSAGELRDLADALPLPGATARHLPVLPTYLPRQSYVMNSARYLLGPVGLASSGATLSPVVVNFNSGAEVALGRYQSGAGEAVLTLIAYPTPQIAGERLRAIEALMRDPQAANQFAGGVPAAIKRSGPMVVVVTGAIAPGEAKSLVASVNYDADVTWNQGTFLGKKDNAGNLIVNAILLTGIILLLCLVAGIAFGGFRILMKRLYPDRVFDRPQDVEIIRLNLRG